VKVNQKLPIRSSRLHPAIGCHHHGVQPARVRKVFISIRWLKGWRVHEGVVRVMYTTKELTKETWPDFERLFSQGNGWDFCWCMHFQRLRKLPRNQWRPTRAERGTRNRTQKKELVERDTRTGFWFTPMASRCVGANTDEAKSCLGSTTTAVIVRWAWKG
jgi:hypothetical protein